MLYYTATTVPNIFAGAGFLGNPEKIVYLVFGYMSTMRAMMNDKCGMMNGEETCGVCKVSCLENQ